MKTVYKNNITMDPSGFVLLADFVPHIVQEIQSWQKRPQSLCLLL